MTPPPAAGVVRRPSGEPPPLPRQVSPGTTTLGGLLVVVVALWVALSTTAGMRVVTDVDLVVLRAVARLRTDAVDDVADAVVGTSAWWLFRVVAWGTLLVLLVTRRFQHLLVVLAVLLTVPVLHAAVAQGIGRPRPAGIELLGRWDGFAHPSQPVANLTLAVTAAVLVLAPRGRWRRRAVVAACVVVGLVVVGRTYAAVDHPSDIAAAVAVGVAVPVLALRLATPEEAFPVTYRRGVRAHLDVGGRRGEAIRAALAQQLGVEVLAVEPFALGGSAGSTPLRLTTVDGQRLFAKLYASTHLWSDRWYKLARTVRYGRLEDERPFNTVRRLVEYEDHMARVLRDAGVRTPTPYGIVEITPEREYLLVTEFVDGPCITEGAVDDAVVDDALGAVRRLWFAGLTHRDIKPGNVLVAGGQVWLVDVSFAEVRPTPWRQAVDLANMLLTLGLCVPPERVYERALRRFSEDEIAEAFAATRSVTVPAQLRAMLRAAGEPVLDRFRALAPARPPVAIQHWSVRRVALTAGLVLAVVAAVALVTENLQLAGLL